MFESTNPAEPAKKVNVAKPAIGMAISFCVFVASLMAGVVVLCGPGGTGYNKGPGTSAQQVMSWFFPALMGLSALVGVVCFLWLVVALIRRGLRD